MRRSFPLFLCAVLLSLAAGCGNDSSDTGRLTLRVADGPVDEADEVWIAFTAVEVKPAGGEAIRFDFAEVRKFDLLTLTDGASGLLLDSVALDAGQYNWIRLDVALAPEDVEPGSFTDADFCYVAVGGTSYPLRIPSGEETGLKLNRTFVVPHGRTADFTVDFDLRKSLHTAENGDAYILRPTLRIVDNAEAGAIAGTVTGVTGEQCPMGTVYVFEGSVEPDDVDGIPADPLTSAKAHLEDGVCRYRAAFLPPGLYTVAFTWDAGADDPAEDDDEVAFPYDAEALVEADRTTDVPIPLGP